MHRVSFSHTKDNPMHWVKNKNTRPNPMHRVRNKNTGANPMHRVRKKNTLDKPMHRVRFSLFDILSPHKIKSNNPNDCVIIHIISSTLQTTPNTSACATSGAVGLLCRYFNEMGSGKDNVLTLR